MLSLTLSSSTDELDLGALLDGSYGMQAVAGLTGTGLPPVSVQWAEGAGDGAVYRGKRVLPRDVDIPLFIDGEGRPGLRALVKRLAIILADEANLTLTDSLGDAWVLNVVRVGGGDFIYGGDTDGENSLQIVVTLRAGQPFWTRVAGEAFYKTDFTNDTMLIPSDLSVETPPVWRVTGPGKDLTIISPKGERLEWIGSLANGEALWIDARNGTVESGTGESRYANLGPSPRFAKIPLGADGWTVKFPNADAGLARTNLCTNPTGSVNAVGWSGGNAWSSVTRPSAGVLRVTADSGTPVQAKIVALNTSIAVTPGKTYSARATFADSWVAGLTVIFAQYASNGDYLGEASMLTEFGNSDKSGSAVAWTGAATMRVSFSFVRTSSLAPMYADYSSVLIEQAQSASGYFDGDTTDTAYNNYAWTGTAGGSTSTLTITPNRATSEVACLFNPRDWMVV